MRYISHLNLKGVSLMKNIKNKFKVVMAIIVATAVLAGCTANTGDQEDDVLNVVATTSMLGDLASVIGGDAVKVTHLMGPGIDPHLYQASANDVTRLQDADVVIYNGIDLEGKMGDVFGSLEDDGKDIIRAEDALDDDALLPADEDEDYLHDPHIWFDVDLWKQVASHIKEELSTIDPDNKEIYQSNYTAYVEELDELVTYIENRIKEIPEEQRVLITAHDAFGYFGEAYDFEVIGLQGVSTEAEAGTSDISSLADFIAENQIKAIFIESSVSPRTIESLQAAVTSRGFDVEIGGELYSDALGDAASGHDTYITTFKANIDTIVDALK